MHNHFTKYCTCVLASFSLHSSLAEAPVGKLQYQSGVELLKGGDEVAAFDSFKKSMDWGYPDAFSASGFFYANGRGDVEKNDAKAFEFFQKGADLGSQAAQVNLGRFYLEGRGVGADREKGLALMEAAAFEGSEDAQAALAEIYFMGLYDPASKPDFAKALPYVQACADRESASALNMLGLIYKEGHGVAVNSNKAEELFRQAALKGDFKAQSNLGELLDPYSKKNSRRIEAVAWLIVASRQGEPMAIYRTGELQAEMKPAEWQKATALADELEAKIQP
jgi:TPR repeat protein